MDKKFVSGTVFGLVLGVAVSVATPMLGAKDITIKKPSSASRSTATNNNAQAAPDNNTSGLSAETNQLLKEISSSLKENSQQNGEIIQQLTSLNKKQGL